MSLREMLRNEEKYLYFRSRYVLNVHMIHLSISNECYLTADYNGYVGIVCTEACLVEYHIQCWKKFKSSFIDLSSDKVKNV